MECNYLEAYAIIEDLLERIEASETISYTPKEKRILTDALTVFKMDLEETEQELRATEIWNEICKE